MLCKRVKDFSEGNAENSVKNMRSEIFRMVKMLVWVFWVMLCSTLKVEAICSYETLITTCKKTHCQNLEDQLAKIKEYKSFYVWFIHLLHEYTTHLLQNYFAFT
jgi:hypothetical protein